MVVDILIIGFLLACVIAGLAQGLTRTAGNIANIILSLIISALLHRWVLSLIILTPISGFFGSQHWALNLTYVLTFFMALSLLDLLRHIFFGFLRRLPLLFLDRFLGLFLGIISGALWTTILITFIYMFPVFRAPQWLTTPLANFFLYYATQVQAGWQVIAGVS
ncbi:MAG: CvpA family protein [Spirochaetaceae bacterium]|nr:CvpA family protein [Spirochaetaceae bacterium]